MGTDEPTAAEGRSTISFADVVIDRDSFQVYRAGEPVSIEPQVFDVLCYLIDHRDRVVGKAELLDNIWGDQFVGDSALATRVKSARRAVGDDGRRQEIIRTTHGRGYRFVAEVTETNNDGDAAPTTEPASAVIEHVEGGSRESHVPAPARPLVARDRELATLIALLTANRLVTVVGPGGVGKTRLATEVATIWDHDFDDAVTFAALARLSGANEVIGAIRDALGGGNDHSNDVFGAAREALAGKSALLVLDNFEHVVDAATTLADLVESVPGIRLLVTSRERLGLAGEQVLELEPLSLAPDDSADSSGIAPAVMFFEHAVQGVGSDVRIDANHDDDVNAICKMLDGLPLAIELAAAHTRYFPLSYLRTHLESQAITVADHARDRPKRHQTMSATIEWSYGLLTPNQQSLLAALSVYRSGWPFEAADTITGVDKSSGGAHDLLALVDKSLVQRTDGVLGEPRFSMLHLLREFAGSQLDASGRRNETLDQHAISISRTVRSLEDQRWADGGDGWIDAINAEYPDAVAALTWCFTGGGEPKVGCEIVAALGFWWYRSGRHGEGRVWVDHALANAAATDDSTMAWIHAAAGRSAAYLLRPDKCREHFDTALNLARQIGDERLEALSLCDLGAATASLPNQYESGLEAVHLGLDHARRLGTPQIIAHGLTVLGELTRANGHPDTAEAAYREALDFNVQIGDRHYEAINVLNMGHALMAQDRTQEALSYHRRGIGLSSQLGSRIMMAWNLSGLATAFDLLGHPRLAARLIGAADAALNVLGATHGPVDQPIHDERQRALRDELGADEYEKLVGEGGQMPLAEGIEIALAAIDREHVPAGQAHIPC